MLSALVSIHALYPEAPLTRRFSQKMRAHRTGTDFHLVSGLQIEPTGICLQSDLTVVELDYEPSA